MINHCQYLGSEQDPWNGPVHYCGQQTLKGKSYCHDHYWQVYARGSAIAGRRNEREIDREIADLKAIQELDMGCDDV